MKNALVLIPFTGSISIYLTDLPDDTKEEDCFSLALDNIAQGDEWFRQINEIEYHRQVNKGNVCYNSTPEMQVEWEYFEEDEEMPPTIKSNQNCFNDEQEVNECDDLCWGMT